ncbi:unnamed protein product [Peniophora sp. CBMAI 1063]|nr:unnamed protein product [Peniophora sp. CBMAI 1063]
MCHIRRVHNVYTCGHRIPLDENIHCNSPNCKFSSFHPQNCPQAFCKKTCWQYRQSPEQIPLHHQYPCHACAR